jgi:hypothetical protein
MSKLIYKGDVIDNFGEFLPAPYIEAIRILPAEYVSEDDYDENNTEIEVDISIFLIDSSYNSGATDGSLGATAESSVATWLQDFNSNSFGGGYDSLQRKLAVYLAATTSSTKMNKVLNPNRGDNEFIFDELYQEVIGYFEEFTKSAEELFTDDGKKIIKYYMTLTLPVPNIIVSGEPLAGENIAKWSSSMTGHDQLMIFSFSALIHYPDFETEYGSDDYRRDPSEPSISKLMQGQFSDISYEDILYNKKLITELAVFVDEEGVVYGGTPLQDNSGRYRKVGNMGAPEIVSLFESLVKENSSENNDEETQNALDGISYVVATYGFSSASEASITYEDNIKVAGVNELIPQLEILRQHWPHKAPGTSAGILYSKFKKLVAAVNAAVATQPLVTKRIISNGKISDLRSPALLGYSPGEGVDNGFRGARGHIIDAPEEPADSAGDISTFIIEEAIAGAMMYRKEVDGIENADYAAYPAPISSDFTILRRGFWFFDYEKALLGRSCLNLLFDIKRFQRWFGKSMVQSRYLVKDVELQKVNADAGGRGGISVRRKWRIKMLSPEGETVPPNSQPWPVAEECFDGNLTGLPRCGGALITEPPSVDSRPDRGHTDDSRGSYYDQDESGWEVVGAHLSADGTEKNIYGNTSQPSLPGRASHHRGIPNIHTPNRYVPGDGYSTQYVGTPPLPIPKSIEIDKNGRTSTNKYSAGKFPGTFHGVTTTQSNTRKIRGWMIPRNLARHGPMGGDGVSTGASTNYDPDVYHPAWLAPGNGVSHPDDDLAGDKLDLRPHGYRMMCFEWVDIYDNENGWYGDEYTNKTTVHNAYVTVEDYTAGIAEDLMQSYEDVMTGDLGTYIEYATEFCAYNQIEDRFTPFFADAITAYYNLEANEARTPWVKGPLVYYMHRDLLFGEFGGGTLAAKQAVYDAAHNMASKINPNTGKLSNLLTFRDMFERLWGEYYTSTGIVRSRLNGDGMDTGPLTIPYTHNFQTRLDLDLNRGAPIDITQQQDYSALIDVTIEDPVVPEDFCSYTSDDDFRWPLSTGDECPNNMRFDSTPAAWVFTQIARTFNGEDGVDCGCECPDYYKWVPYGNPRGAWLSNPWTGATEWVTYPAEPLECEDQQAHPVARALRGYCVRHYCESRGLAWSAEHCRCVSMSGYIPDPDLT